MERLKLFLSHLSLEGNTQPQFQHLSTRFFWNSLRLLWK